MADSKKPALLLLKCATLLAAAVISYTALVYACLDIKQQDYMAATFDKMKLLQRTPSPKVIFIGGSNLALGIDSARIRKELGRPVVNMGLHAGLGLKFMLDQVEPYLRPGDTLVVVPEYQHFTGEIFYSEMTCLMEHAKLTHDWSALAALPLVKLANVMLRSNEAVFRYTPAGVRNPSFAFARKDFNCDGDMIAHLCMPNRKAILANVLAGDVNGAAVDYLHDFTARNERHGVTTVLIYPCLPKTYYSSHAAIIGSIAGALTKGGVRTLCSPSDFTYNDDLFFDSVYHLNAQGRQLRTAKMIQTLQPLTGNAPPLQVQQTALRPKVAYGATWHKK
jgi:hypothetical protein